MRGNDRCSPILNALLIVHQTRHQLIVFYDAVVHKLVLTKTTAKNAIHYSLSRSSEYRQVLTIAFRLDKKFYFEVISPPRRRQILVPNPFVGAEFDNFD